MVAPEHRWIDRRDDRAAGRLARPGAGQLTDFDGEGLLGDCRIKTGLGAHPARPGRHADLKTGIGDISADHATGHAEITAGSGDVHLRKLEAGAVVKNSNGDTWVGAAAGDLKISAANGSIAVGVASAGVTAKSSNGDVRLDEAVRGSVVLETRLGDVEVGDPRRHHRLARRARRRRQGQQRARRRRSPGAGGRDRRGARAHGRRQRRSIRRP